MGEWLWWALGFVCLAFAALKVAAGVWCLVALRRWRAVPELWGVDWLDIVYRIERGFGVQLTSADFASWPADARAGLTAGQLWEVVAAKVRASGAEVPLDGWARLVAALSEALGVRGHRISAESRLYADLRMLYGLEGI